MAVQTFTRPHDYDPSVTKEVVVGEPHKIPASAPYHIFLRHVPRQQTPSTVKVSGGGITWTEVSTPPSASGQYRVRYDEALGRIEFHSSDAGKEITVDYNACGTVVWGEKHDDGRPNIAEIQEVLERVQEAGGIDYSSSVSGFSPADVKAALDALAGVRIVEMGSNSNGEYVRWENGLQICFVRGVAFTGDGTSDVKSGYWTHPAAFASHPAIVGRNVHDYVDPAWHIEVNPGGDSGRTNVFWRAYRTRTSWTPGTEYLLHYIAIGRWK